ncbi:hypothetical protein LCI18_011254 [Fusarium solani-melongenae]|uniref:Uncharacterized protein n=1 Tax=Fusarium solani subsp. cucurbitae TaxID=2747967 RepID=A0ACD3ZGA0_FUSSC|nr:hypothetical protein LCI18_011254 [Fusarium solani-melongenae]
MRGNSKPCHTCRSRRLTCDSSQPHCKRCTFSGIQCLGYGRLFKWTNSVASRGKSAGKSLPAKYADAQGENVCRIRDEKALAAAQRATSSSKVQSIGCFQLSPSSPVGLGDPSFRHVHPMARYYLDYFAHRLCRDLVAVDLPDRNPFRRLVSMGVHHPILHQAMIAAASAHMSNFLKAPFSGEPASTSPLAHWDASVEASRRALVHSFQARQRSLRLLHTALQNLQSCERIVLLTTILLLINIELIESGRHSWKAHLEGAIQLFLHTPPVGQDEETLGKFVISDLIVYSAFAQSLVKDPLSGLLATLAQSKSILLQNASMNSYMCCPPEILQLLATAAHLSNEAADDKFAGDVMKAGLDLFNTALSFDIDAWAANTYCVPIERQSMNTQCRKNAGAAHQLSVCLYILRAIPSIHSMIPCDLRDCIERDLLFYLSSIPDQDPNFHSTLWPVFVPGAETVTLDQQTWILDRFWRIGLVFPWGSLGTAVNTLRLIWRSRDQSELFVNWLDIVKRAKMNLLLV